VHELPASYREAHRYDGAAVEHGGRDELEPCAIQPRDVAIIRDVARYKFLTGPQVRELWWPTASVQAADRRLLKLFRAGHVERIRPYARRGLGSYPWTYYLGKEGHRLLCDAGVISDGHRYSRRLVFDYGHILHEVQLNAWVLAYRRALGTGFHSWEGETSIDPPARLLRADQQRLDDDWSPEGLRDPRARPVRPDAVLEIAGDTPTDDGRLLLVEYDRTRRLDKNFEKFRRYDAFLTRWWQHTEFASKGVPPFVLFVCQDDEQRDLFMDAADRELTGRRWHPDVGAEHHEYIGRQRFLFADELDAHAGYAEAYRLPALPLGHRDRNGDIRRVRIAPRATTERTGETNRPCPERP
jgi:Replication-relaxation